MNDAELIQAVLGGDRDAARRLLLCLASLRTQKTSKDLAEELVTAKAALEVARQKYSDWSRANRLADEAGVLRDEKRELLAENAELRRKVERLERRK